MGLLFCLSFQAQNTFESTPLPLITVETLGQEIKDSCRIDAQMGISFKGDKQENKPGDPFNEYEGWINIKQRGFTSADYPKKQYRIETTNEDGSNRNIELLGLPKEHDWILSAPYADRTLLRNVLTYELARQMGHYAARTRFCELLLNGSYQGIYVFTEKIKRDKARLDLAKLLSTDISGIELTGGYILQIDRAEGIPNEGWASPYNNSLGFSYQFLYEYPKASEIVPQQAQYIQNYIQDFEDAMFGPDFQDSLLGYRKYIDENSFVDYLILNEVSKNIDAYRFSTFLYKDKGEKLKIGPVWDMNLAWSNAGYNDDHLPMGLLAGTIEPNHWNTPGHPLWWKRLLDDPYFTDKLRCRWESLRKSILNRNHIFALMDGYVEEMGAAIERNHHRWSLSEPVSDVQARAEYEWEINRMKNWIVDRIQWMDHGLPGQCAQKVSISSHVFPNPFSSYTEVSFTLSADDQVEAYVLDIQGRKITQIFRSRFYAQGEHRFVWDGFGLNRKILDKGMYFLYLKPLHGETVVHKILKF